MYYTDMNKAIFLDRDGTVNYGVPRYERVNSIDKVEILPQAIEGLARLASTDYKLFLVTNQAGLSEGLITWDDFHAINNKVLELITPSGVKIEETFVCPHGETETCECRKPKPKLLQDAAQKYDIDLSASWMIGDRSTDIMTGVNAGTKTVLVKTGAIDNDPHATFIANDLLEAAEYIIAKELRN